MLFWLLTLFLKIFLLFLFLNINFFRLLRRMSWLIIWYSGLLEGVFHVCSFINILLFLFFLILLSLVINVALTPALILKLRVTLLFKRVFSLWYSWHLAFLSLFEVGFNLSRLLVWIIIVWLLMRYSCLDDLIFSYRFIGVLCRLDWLGVKHLVKFLLASHLFTDLHLS